MTTDVITCLSCGKQWSHTDWYVLLLMAGNHIGKCKRKNG